MSDACFQNRLTFSTLTCPGWTLPQIVHNAHKHKLNGVDFRGIGPELDITLLKEFGPNLEQTLHLLQQHDLQMPCLNTSVALLTPGQSEWDAMLQELGRYAHLGQRAGSRLIRVFGGAILNCMDRSDAVILVKQRLREAVTICQPMGCRVLLETHDAWTRSDQLLEVVSDFDPAEAGVLWDLEHPWRSGELPAKTATDLAACIQHVHIKDTIRKDGISKPTLLGEGEIPLGQCLHALSQIGYAAWICLETEKRWHADGPEPEQSVPQFVKYMRSVGTDNR